MEKEAPSSAATEIAERYGVKIDTLKAFGAFESEVVHGDSPSGPLVLKVFDASRRTEDEILAELLWLRALREQNLPVVEPVTSLEGRWIEPVTNDQGDPTHAAGYRKAPGVHKPYTEWTPAFTKKFGSLMGRLHEHTRNQPLEGPSRPFWRKLDGIREADVAFGDDPEMLDAVASLTPSIEAVEKRLDDHGLIHADAHAWNVLVDGEDMTLIDFDDAVVGPYLYDLAVILYYAVATQPSEAPSVVATAFLTPFLEGFDSVTERPQGTAEDVATLLAMRRTDLAIAVHTHVPKEKWDDDLRDAAQRLRTRTIEQHELVPLETLRTFFG